MAPETVSHLKEFGADRQEGWPRHVAIITDGNGRWARARGLPVNEGHSAGADTVKARLRDAAELPAAASTKRS